MMADRSHLVVQAEAWRKLAERARRLAGGLLDDSERNRLLDYSEELDQKAARLQAEAGAEPGDRDDPPKPAEPNWTELTANTWPGRTS
jgi:hypothetical protein